MYLNFKNPRVWVADIEGDPIPSTVVHCMAAKNAVTQEEWFSNSPEEIKAWLQVRKAEGCKFVFHNGLGYDGPTLNRILKAGLVLSDIIDTMVMSMVYSPSIEGGHSLDAWGKRLRFPKGDFNDFSKYSEEMKKYCIQDVRLGLKVYLELARRMIRLGFTDDSLDLEHRAWSILKTQQNNGFAFNYKEALRLYTEIRDKENDIRDRILEVWPPELQCVAEYSRPYKKDGTPTANFKRHAEEYERVELVGQSSYRCYSFVSFNIGSPPQRIERLLELGWEPREFTKKTDKGGGGNPKVTAKGRLVPSLEEFVEKTDHPGPKLIAKWIELNARANMINTWLEAYNDRTNCIHGSLWLANTHRYRHSNPNTANIPAVRIDGEGSPRRGEDGVYTYEARDLWVTRDSSNRRMVGVDAKGIQLRILAHYLGDKEFSSAVLSEDPHAANQARMGLPTRSLAKTITYAILMGAGDGRISSEAKVSLKEAKTHKSTFFGMVPVKPLMDRLKSELQKTGRISLCDGSKILVSSDHMVIPYLLQGDESKIMKKAMINIAQKCRREGIDALQVGMIHDELQFDVLEKDVKRFTEICLESFIEAGKYFNYTVPIEGDFKVGMSWAKTH